eukprot:TRINITY_DN63394_c0_g1_i1.p1 TRINITY_DN63394_c0_g1~~TRINITY_DN63394_c0_g1_i1.p1  ORF type:complete len:251 (+),score=27.43 TRINITY_DN63394_c0_g1_i1:39-791(+)
MRGLIILAVAVALALADDTLIRKRRDAGRAGGWGFSYAGARIDAQQMQLAQLNHMLEELEGKVGEDDHSADVALAAVENRLDHIEGDDCGDQVSCGRLSGQCINSLEYCDGHQDCDNNHDEDEHTCQNLVPAGRSWTGRAVWNHCLVRNNNVITVLITGNRRYDHFKGRIFVDAVLIESYTSGGEKKQKTWSTSGQFDFADRSIRLRAPEGSSAHIGTVCHDAGPGVAFCEFIRESDHTVCGTATLRREV